MKKIIYIGVICSFLIGCASQQVDKNLSNFSGVTYNDYDGKYKTIKNFTMNSSTNKSLSDINVCLLQNIENEDINLSDTSKSFIGPYSGNYYNVTSRSKSLGGSVQQYSDDKTIIVKGVTKYLNPQTWVPITNYVRYTLTVQKDKESLAFTFNNIRQAQSETGYLPNNGFGTVGNWEGANPSIMLKALEGEVLKINSCLNHG